MPLYHTDIEDFCNALVTLLQQPAFAVRLAAIDVVKADGILCPAPTVRFGELDPESEYPVIYISPASEDEINDYGDGRYGWWSFSIDCYSVGDNTHNLDKQLVRYARAIYEEIMNVANYKGVVFISGIAYPPTIGWKGSLLKACLIRGRFRFDVTH